MTDTELRASLADSMTAFTSLAGGRPETPIPSCPGWSLEDLVVHAGNVHHLATEYLRADPDTPLDRPSRIPAGDDLASWFREQADALLAELDRTDLAAISPTWRGPQPRRWWLRRQTHELLVHHWDGATALGQETDIDPGIAVDGIDEILEVFVAAMAEWGKNFGPDSGTLHLHATDASGEWLIDLGTDPVEWDRRHAKGDLAIKAPAGDLLLLLWGRDREADVETFGDLAVLEQWQAGFRL